MPPQMSRLTLIHWDPVEGSQRARRLRAAGHRVALVSAIDAAGLRSLSTKPPEAFVIDLGRIPTQGRDLGILLRRRKATRGVPLVFAAGEPRKVAEVRRLLPDAVFAEWRGIRGAIQRALRRPPAKPVVQEAMAGYSGTPLPQKLGIKPGSTVAMLGAPTGFEKALGKLPVDVRIRRRAGGSAERILLFVRSRAELRRRFPIAARALARRGGLWIVWPKKASGLAKDLDQSGVRTFGLDAGFVDYKIAAIDETWSGLLFARRSSASRQTP